MGNPAYIQAGERAAAFIRNHLVREDGRLFARYREGEAAYLATVEDYAFLYGACSNCMRPHLMEYLGICADASTGYVPLFWMKKQEDFYQRKRYRGFDHE